ncbi:sensor histidine kinase [Lutibaculum baratangense]|uniref:histidine kinase n=1 Tax=Lutibaculum baratangense AMV1 TaxID=631454 RepID=V4RB37_9HYPH|nr:ATP-binding protein [Lutibaculum baratangense]ESR22619.1 two-component hybrid sensor and regulator [Lutibaculum baratangense AMV1]
MSAEADFIELFDGGGEAPAPLGPPWKVAVIDDDAAVHEGTRFALRDFRLEGRGIELLSAFSASEGRALLADHPDIAVILLDVVMEEDEAGLELVDVVRNELANETVRIILRTGQPGQAPERRVVVDYDINDYKAKTELTADKLFTALVSALRGFEQLRQLTVFRAGLEAVIEAGAELLAAEDVDALAGTAARRAAGLVPGATEVAVSLQCPAAGRAFARWGAPSDPPLDGLLDEGLRRRRAMEGEGRSVHFAVSGTCSEVVLAVAHGGEAAASARGLADLFCTRVSVALDNLRLRRQLHRAKDDLERRVAARTAELVGANRRLEAQGQDLRRANAFKNEILGTIAHDLKNPLNVMLGRAQILGELVEMSPLPKEPAHRQIEEIRKAGSRLSSMIDSLISNAMMDAADISLDRAEIDIGELARQVAETNRAAAERKAQDIALGAEAGLLVHGDGERLREAFDNLVGNAVKYSPPGAPIEVSVERTGGRVLLSVRDRGPGLSPEDLRRVFTRFQRLSAQPTGGESSTGLGLSIVKRIVELHGGEATAANRPGGGAVFAISLPLIGEEARK